MNNDSKVWKRNVLSRRAIAPEQDSDQSQQVRRQLFFVRRETNMTQLQVAQGPVVQSVVSLTSPKGHFVNGFNIQYSDIFAEKMWVVFALQKLLTCFQQNILAYRITQCKF